jgi:hypothetical protein
MVSGTRNGRPGQWDLAQLLKLLARNSASHEFFVTLADTARELNRQTKISAVRDAVAKTDLSEKIAHELAYHITSIRSSRRRPNPRLIPTVLSLSWDYSFHYYEKVFHYCIASGWLFCV